MAIGIKTQHVLIVTISLFVSSEYTQATICHKAISLLADKITCIIFFLSINCVFFTNVFLVGLCQVLFYSWSSYQPSHISRILVENKKGDKIRVRKHPLFASPKMKVSTGMIQVAMPSL